MPPTSHLMFLRLDNSMYTNRSYHNMNITFWLKEQHDSDPEKDWNPLYAISGRPENDKDEQCGTRTTFNNPTLDSSPIDLRIRNVYNNRTRLWRRAYTKGNTSWGG